MHLTPPELLAEFQDLLRTMPAYDSFYDQRDEIDAWSGRARALIGKIGDIRLNINLVAHLDVMADTQNSLFDSSLKKIKAILHEVIYSLQLETTGPLTTVVNEGSVYEYFDILRKEIESAKTDLLFIDPYLDHEFVGHYLPFVTEGVTVRLLTSNSKIKTLIPAIELFSKQYPLSIEVRISDGLHDRYMFVDQQACYQSGSSFKDGEKKSPTTLT